MAHRGASLAAAALVALAVTARIEAAAVDVGGLLVEVEYFAGTGDNTSYLIVDLDAQGGGVYAFGYRWDPIDAHTGLDMIDAVAAAGDLDAVITPFVFGDALTNFSYQGDTGVPLFDFFFGELWLGEVIAGAMQWTSSLVGAGDRALSDGSFDGWVNTFDSVQPRVPSAAAVPAPGAGGILAAGAILLIARRRRA